MDTRVIENTVFGNKLSNSPLRYGAFLARLDREVLLILCKFNDFERFRDRLAFSLRAAAKFRVSGTRIAETNNSSRKIDSFHGAIQVGRGCVAIKPLPSALNRVEFPAKLKGGSDSNCSARKLSGQGFCRIWG